MQGFVVRGLELGVRVSGFRLRVWRLACRAQGQGSTVPGFMIRGSLCEYGNPGPCLGMAWADTDNPDYSIKINVIKIRGQRLKVCPGVLGECVAEHLDEPKGVRINSPHPFHAKAPSETASFYYFYHTRKVE